MHALLVSFIQYYDVVLSLRDFVSAMRRVLPIIILTYLFLSCSDGRKNTRDDAMSEEENLRDTLVASGLSGQELAAAHCSTCHAFVPPESLTKTAWKEDVLPIMGQRLGIYAEGFRPNSVFEQGPGGAIVRRANIFPEHPLIAEADWRKIEEYFMDHAPDTITPPIREKKIHMGLRHFKYRESPFVHRPPLTSMVKILPDKRGIVFSDGKTNANVLTFLSTDLQEDYSVRLPLTPVQFQERSNGILLTTIGKGVFPNDAPDGSLLRLERKFPQPRYTLSDTIVKGLQRPVWMAYGDLNHDGNEDIVVCEFGNKTGRLSWLKSNGTGGYSKKVLRDRPGAVMAIIKDANRDGLPDIYVLMGQGDEGVFLYENQGSDLFIEKRLLTFSPLHGSQYIELADFNNDGHEDIVYVCGDNADFTPILKSYHGIYIFLNDGKSSFRQAFFYPMNGAYKAIARDFDLDGDLDIAAISFFPDYVRYPEESFVYLVNKGNMKFDDYSFPQASKGRWMVMDAGDMDADGDVDLVLGSFVYFLPDGDTTGLGKKWLSTSPSVVVLENTIR